MAAGSVTGRDHVLAGRGNQDAFALVRSGEVVVGVVADGCGSGRYSEVGARLGAGIYARALLARLGCGGAPDDAGVHEAVTDEVLSRLGSLATALGPVAEVVSEHFLFTVVGAALTPERVVVFARGDGVYAIDGDRVALGPYENDAPPYLGYALLPGRRGDRPVVLEARSSESVGSVAIGTDGALALDSFDRLAERDGLFRNPDALRRELARQNPTAPTIDWERRRVTRPRALLSDDTTVVVLRRRATS